MQKLHHVKVFTDLGEHYVQGERLDEIYDISVSHTSSGTHIVTSTKGCICTFLQKDGTETGNKAVKSEILSSICCSLKSDETNRDGEKDEKMYILGALGNQVYIMGQNGDTIGEPRQAEVAAPTHAVSIEKYVPLPTETGYKILVVYRNDSDQIWSMGYFEWSNGIVSSAMDSGILMSSPKVSWVKRENQDCVLYEWEGGIYVDNPCPAYDQTRFCRRKLMLGDSEGRLVGTSVEWCFFIDGEGVLSAYPLSVLESGDISPLWSIETGDTDISEARIVDAYGVRQLFLFSAKQQKLYHCPLIEDEGSGKFVCFPIETNVTHYSVDAGDDYLHLCLVKGDEDAPQIMHHSMPSPQSDWVENGVYLESEEKVEKIQGHITDLVFCGEDESPIPNQKVLLWTSESTTIYVGGKMLRVSPETPYLVEGDDRGNLEIMQVSDSLNGSVIIFREVNDEGNPQGNYYTITPGEKYKTKLKGMKKEDLDSAVTANGERLVDDDFDGQRDEVLEHTANAMQNMLTGTENSENEELEKIKDPSSDTKSSLRTVIYKEDPTLYFGKMTKSGAVKSCVVRFSEGRLTYRQVSPEEAFAHIENTYKAVYGVNAFQLQSADQLVGAASNNFFSSISSFFKSVVKGIVKVTEIVIYAVENAVTATVRFVDNAVHQVASFAVEAVKDAVHLVENVLKQIKVGIEKVIQWIGFMLDWKDIQNSAKYIESMFEKSFEAFNDILDQVESYADEKLVGLEEKVEEYLKRFQKDLSDDNLNENAKQSGEDDPVSQADAHNMVKKHLMETEVAQCYFDVRLDDEEQEAIEGFVHIAERVSSLGTLDTSQLTNRLKDGKCSLKLIGDAFMSIIGMLVENLIQLAREELHILMSAIKALLKIVKGMLTYQIRIPLISALIKSVTGMDLTVMNLVSFLIAIPYTIAYKLIYHQAPVSAAEENLDTDLKENNGGILLSSILTILIGVMQTAKTAVMCFNPPRVTAAWPIGLLGAIEIVCMLFYITYVISYLKETNIKQSILFAIGGTLGILANCCDIAYARGTFTRDAGYYDLKLTCCLTECVLGVLLVLSKYYFVGIPGGTLFAFNEGLSCCFYRNWAGEQKGIIGFSAVLSVVMVITNIAFFEESNKKSTTYCLESCV